MPDLNWQLRIPTEAEQELFLHHKLNDIMISIAETQDGLDRMKNFKVRDSDIFICSHPRSGTHWLAYIISLIVHNGRLIDGNDHGLFNSIDYISIDVKEEYKIENDPRILFSHLPYQYFKEIGKPSTKYIYIARNPKEVVVSNYNFINKYLKTFKGTWEQFVDCFAKGETIYGGWLAHLSEWWIHRNDENVLFIWYEDLLNDFSEIVKKIADYLGYPLSNELAETIRKKASFEEMKKDKETKISKVFGTESSTFFRSGSNETWRNELTPEQNEKMDRLLEQAYRTLRWDVKFS